MCLRTWYERNKHIFPASRWEPYDPEKKWSKYTVSSVLKNCFFYYFYLAKSAIEILQVVGEVNIGEKKPRRSRGFYSTIFTEPEVNNCFSIITEVLGIKSIKKQNLEPKNAQNGKQPF